MRFRLFAALAVVFILTAVSLYAHHSFAATYDESKSITIQGKVAAFLLRNPHSFIHVEVKAEDGKTVRYGVEGASAQQFAQQGVNRDALQPGDVVVVTGNPGRNPTDYRMRLRSITRPSDGWKWSGQFD
jgi:hypothetical protein